TMVQHELTTAQYAFETSIENLAQGAYRYSNDMFYKGSRNISNNTKFFDNFSKEVDLQVSIFYDNIRVATSLIDDEGNRMIDMEADPIIYDKVVKEGQYYFSSDLEINGNTYYAMYCPLQQHNSDEIIGMTFVGLEKSDIQSLYISSFIKSVMSLVIIFVLGIIVTIASVRVISKAIKVVIDKLNKVADGGLDVKVESKLLKRADEIGDIAYSVEKLVGSLSGIVVDIKKASSDLDEISEGFSGSFDKMADNIGSVDTAVEEMASGSTQQAQDTADVGNKIQYMGDAVETTAQNVERLVGNTDKMRAYNKSVDDTLEELIRISNETQDAFSVVFEQTNMTNQSAQDIQT
ncbi:MAG: methyl-accepting chemotaxis protein, partial [Lachnospiraceae bacterium]|nr:methyl-accepting chemotaxis protein [Lachnospiraceae bacterium]